MSSAAWLNRYRTDDGPVILDGGLASELEAQGIQMQGDPLWSARVLQTNPQAIKEAHHRYLLSGADVITTATYQASIKGFVSYLNMTPEEAKELVMSGVHLAKETVDRFLSKNHSIEQKSPMVAASVGPYGAFLHDCSEYTGAYADNMSVEELKGWHRAQVSCLVAAGADLIAFETFPSIKEAEAVVELLREFPNAKAWLSFSCKDERCISDGSLFTEAVQIAKRTKQLVAVGVNCCSPTLVTPLLDSAKSLRSPDMSWVVYPDSGEDWDENTGWLPSEKIPIAELSLDWMKQGAALIGGCCRIGPAQIAEVRQHLKRSYTSQGSAMGLD
ncbi:homocysteine S-methyltransferase 1 [Myripristis murdjan]|uniref:Zgc:172121 n=1 Tax=Myripristis murdjan TaxID=586833 RepID=A0A668A3A5_9TELE|nr:homocysteine S-methyltransferase 1-like [Myripristis murdjan]